MVGPRTSDRARHGQRFADLGYPDAEERQTKLRLAYAINEIFAREAINSGGGRDATRRR